MWILGVFMVLAAIFIFFMETGLAKWVPFSLAAAGVILFIGLAIMSFAERSPGEPVIEEHRTRHVDEHHHH